MNLEARQTGYGSSANEIEQQEDIAAAIYEIIQQMNSQTELIVSTMGKLMQKFMSQNEKLMAVMVKKPPGGSAGGGGRGRGYRGIRSKFPSCSELKVGDKHLYNGKTLLTFKHFRKFHSHADDECFELESNEHCRLMYWKTGKRKLYEEGAMNTVEEGSKPDKVDNVNGSYTYLEGSRNYWAPL